MVGWGMGLGLGGNKWSYDEGLEKLLSQESRMGKHCWGRGEVGWKEGRGL